MVGILALAVSCWLAGTLVGFYAWNLYSKLRALYALFKDRLETPAGVVRPTRTRGQTPREIDLSVEAGGVMRPTPDQVLVDHMKQQNKNLERL